MEKKCGLISGVPLLPVEIQRYRDGDGYRDICAGKISSK